MKDFPPVLKIVTLWLLAGALVFVGFQTFLSEQQRAQFSLASGTIEIRRGPDGHYHWPGAVNGVAVDFLVDTGATTTALPDELARRAGLQADGSIVSSTAGGTVRGRMARADLTLDGGVRATQLRVAVLPALHAPLLGMDVLSRLHWAQQGNVLRIEPPPAR